MSKLRTYPGLAWLLVFVELAIICAHAFFFIATPSAVGVFWIAYTLGLLGPSLILAVLETLKWWDASKYRTKFSEWQRAQSRRWEMWSRRNLRF